MIPFKKLKNSLGLKLILWLTLALFFILTAIAAMNIRIQSRILYETELSRAKQIASLILVAMRQHMLVGEQESIQQQLNEAAQLKEIKVINLLDAQGIIKRSTDKTSLGKRSTAQNIKQVLEKGEKFEGIELIGSAPEIIFSEIFPIRNKNKCFSCHDPNQKILGALHIALNWENVLQTISTSKNKNILVSLTGLAIIWILVILFLLKIVVLPLRELESGMNKVARGDLNHQVTIKSKDEIGKLTNLFNSMTLDLKSFMQKEERFAALEIARNKELDILNKQLEKEITQRNTEAQKLKISEQRFKDIASSIADWIWEVDETGKYTFVAGKTQEILGYTKDEIIGKTPFDFMVPAEAEKLKPLFMETLREKKPILDLENTNLTKDGKEVILLTNGVAIIDETGRLKGYRGIDKNITQRKKVEKQLKNAYQQLKDAQQELIHSSKMAAMGQLAAGVSHELNQPLTGIKGFAQTMLLDIPEDSPLRADLLKIIEQANRMDTIIKNVRLFARKSSLQMEQIDINKPINDAIVLLSKNIKTSNIILDVSLAKGLPKIKATNNQLEQVFINLITNAKDAIKSSVDTAGGKISIISALDKSGKNIEISFEDTGSGISQENLENIFNPFFTTKSQSGGMGLGLSICYRIIEMHKGTIKVVSNPGKGTKFIIRLPVSA